MLIRWKSGFVAYWVRGIYYLAIGVVVALAGLWAALTWVGDFGTIRHHISTAAAICIIANLPFAMRRRRYIRFGHQAKWLKAHWLLGGTGLTLLFTHTALDPDTWSGWLAFSLGVAVSSTGFLTHFTRRWTRYYFLRAHFVVVLVLVVTFIAHGRIKLHHPDFPLKNETPKGEIVHDVACAQCHATRNEYSVYACKQCHVHDTDAIREDHELHGVLETDRCLDCHKAKLDGKTYFTGTGRFVPRNIWTFDE